MTKQRYLRVLCLAFALTLCCSFIVSKGFSQNNAEAEDKLPPGKWTFGAHPYLRPGYESMPVIVSGVTSDATKGAEVTKVEIENHSSKPVAAVRLAWYLTTEQDPDTVLQQGQTPFLKLRSTLPDAGARRLKFPVVSFAKIHKPLLKNGLLNGDFRIEIRVSQILYEDGSSWMKG